MHRAGVLIVRCRRHGRNHGELNRNESFVHCATRMGLKNPRGPCLCQEWAAIMPIDTIKTRYTVAKQGVTVRAVVRQILQEAGLRGLYRGFLPTMLRAFPANGAAFGCIDLTERHVFGKHNT